MKKMDTQIKTPKKKKKKPNKNKEKLCHGTQQSPKEHPKRSNPASNQSEFHRDVIRHGQPKCTAGTQKFQDNKNKEYEKIQQTNEIIADLNKYQSETENTTNREINELRMKIDNIKREVTHDMENIRKKRMKQKYKTKWKAIPTK
jgi:hypothetical protein